MRSAFHALPTATLRALAEALRGGRLRLPMSAAGLAKVGIHGISTEVLPEMASAFAGGAETAGLVWGLERLVAERDAHLASQPQLVWTGPETPGTGSRDTRVVVEELFRSAERSVLVATYAIYRGAEVFSLLAERMQAVPDLSVRLFLNITHPGRSPAGAGEARIVRGFMQHFAEHDWPVGVRLPELFYDPRALAPEPGPKACLHAKCIVVDDCRAFVTSANFTEAAQERNIETGVLVGDPAFACALRDQFEALVTAGLLRRVPR